jgi:ribosomal protein S1
MVLMKNLEAVQWHVPTILILCFSVLASCLKVSKAQYDRVWSYIESGKKEGAKVIVGGERRTKPGYWVDATSSPAFLPEI